MTDDGVTMPSGVRFSLDMLVMHLEDGSWACMSCVQGKTYEGRGATHHDAYCSLREAIAKGLRGT